MHGDCGGEGGFKFVLLKDRVKKLNLFDPDKLDSLYLSIKTRACTPHDDKFERGGGILDFLKANLEFLMELWKILHWTTIVSRIIISIPLFFGLNIIGIKYFNWTNLFGYDI